MSNDANIRKLISENKAQLSYERDELLHSNPSAIQKKIKSSRRCNAEKIQKVTVRSKTYVGDCVQDGFYDSISSLKSRDDESLKASQYFQEFSVDYENILELCKLGEEIPQISEK